MARRPKDKHTLDMFTDYVPETVVKRFESEQVRAWSLAGRLAKALKITLGDTPENRKQVAADMAVFLEEDFSKAMLDKYVAETAEHQISAVRLVALTSVTGDARPLNELLSKIDMIAVPAKYEALLRREKARELLEQVGREEQAAEAEWKARR